MCHVVVVAKHSLYMVQSRPASATETSGEGCVAPAGALGPQKVELHMPLHHVLL